MALHVVPTLSGVFIYLWPLSGSLGLQFAQEQRHDVSGSPPLHSQCWPSSFLASFCHFTLP